KKMPKEAYDIGKNQLNNSLSTGAPPKMAAILEQARKDAGLAGVSARGGMSRSKGKSNKKAGFDIYGNGDKKDAAYMDKKYNYQEAQNDIVERDDVSIWQVISNRYTVTGLKR